MATKSPSVARPTLLRLLSREERALLTKLPSAEALRKAFLNLKAAVNAASGGAGSAYGVGNCSQLAGQCRRSDRYNPRLHRHVNGTAGNAITSTTTVAGDEAFTVQRSREALPGVTVAVGGQTYTFVAALSHTATPTEVCQQQ